MEVSKLTKFLLASVAVSRLAARELTFNVPKTSTPADLIVAFAIALQKA